ncbi:hypothetical protein ASF60_09895 [Methylobacterium sp. Leaf113]|nr:hypothetical protein ASF60_09895 [Methylobacterium sp. Leaf113]
MRRRWRRADPRQAISIALAPGVHRLSEPVRFGREDSGTAAIPLVVYGAADGSTRLVGSVPLVPAPDGIPRDLDATLLVDRGAKLRVYRLPAAVTGQRIQEPRTLARRDAPVHLALFDRAGALWPARWPNTGWARTASDVSVSSHNETKASFALADGRSARWRREPELWAEGYWRWNWLFETFPVAAVAPDHLTLEATPYEGIASGARFRIVHALSELDAPGEWWRDAGWGVVLLWPRDPSDAVEVAVTDTLLNVEGASHLRIQALTLEQAQGDLVRISDAADVVISGSRLRRSAGRALSIERSTASGLERSTVAETGIGGVRLSGGDRPSLIPAGLFVRDCRISDYAQSARTQSPAIMVDGVGQTVEGNYIHDTDEYAIHLRGNEHRVAWNEITRILSESTDSGVIYSGRDWSARGSVIEHNYLHDIRAAPGFEIKGIYLDDMASGITVRDNLFVRVDQPIFLGGGRDNRIIENLFVDSSPAIHVDARGRTWAQDAITDPLSELRAAYAAMPVGGKLWRKRYPGLATILADDPAAARNSLTDNVFLNSEPFRFGDLARSGEQNLTRNIGPAGLRLAPLTRSDEQVASRKESVKQFENVLDATNALVRRRDYDRMERSILLKPFEDNRPGHP